MLYHISKLHLDEQELIKKAPLLVSILIAGADGEVDSEEINKSVSLIHSKSFSETSDIRHLYKEIDHDVEAALNDLLKELPADQQERVARITEQLTELNAIVAKLEPQIGEDFYKSLRSFALRVAHTSGGILGFGQINYHEKQIVSLPMLKLTN
jgi:HPt (histidine-containing phosphotransfer) domain-containing protein